MIVTVVGYDKLRSRDYLGWLHLMFLILMKPLLPLLFFASWAWNRNDNIVLLMDSASIAAPLQESADIIQTLIWGWEANEEHFRR